MKILSIFYTTYYSNSLDGSQRRYLEILRHWQNYNDLTVISLEGYPSIVSRYNLKIRSEEVKIYGTTKNGFISKVFSHLIAKFKLYTKGKKIIKSEKIDCILVPLHNYSILQPGVKLSKKYKIPIVVVIHSPERAELQNNIYQMYKIAREKKKSLIESIIWVINQSKARNLIKNTDAIITVSETSKYKIKKLPIKHIPNIYVSSNGINTKKIENMIDNKKNQKHYDIGFIGRIVPEKGVEDLLEALKILKLKNIKPKTIIIGSGREKYMNKLKQFINNNNMENYVKMTGYLEDKKAYNILSKCKIFVSPSWGEAEGWGLAIGEAMAIGLLVIAYATEPVNEIFSQSNSCILIENHNIEALANSIEKNLELSQDQLNVISKNAKQYISKYNWEYVANKDYSILKKVANK